MLFSSTQSITLSLYCRGRITECVGFLEFSVCLTEWQHLAGGPRGCFVCSTDEYLKQLWGKCSSHPFQKHRCDHTSISIILPLPEAELPLEYSESILLFNVFTRTQLFIKYFDNPVHVTSWQVVRSRIRFSNQRKNQSGILALKVNGEKKIIRLMLLLSETKRK